MYYTTNSYSLHEIGLSLQGGMASYDMKLEWARGHPLDWAACLERGYALCFAQKIVAANLNRANLQIRA